MTMQAFMARRLLSSLAKYLPSYIPNLSNLFLEILHDYIAKYICHIFYKDNNTISSKNINISSLKKYLHKLELWYSYPHYKKTIVDKNCFKYNILDTLCHVECESAFYKKYSLIPSIETF